jgi:hypothetical protein
MWAMTSLSKHFMLHMWVLRLGRLPLCSWAQGLWWSASNMLVIQTRSGRGWKCQWRHLPVVHRILGVHIVVIRLRPCECWPVISLGLIHVSYGERGHMVVRNKSNPIAFVTCAVYNRYCTTRPYSEMLTYKPLTNNAVLRKYPPKSKR